MFDSKQGQIPGYTGHVRTFEEPDQFKARNVPQKQIPGKLLITSNMNLKRHLIMIF
jgi:hypothetical protein